MLLQIQPHSELLVVRVSTYEFENVWVRMEDAIQPIAKKQRTALEESLL